MNLEIIREVFGWMTLINLSFYSITSMMTIFLKRLVSRIAGSMFGVDEVTGQAIMYGYVGLYKLLFIVFNLVPWIALRIMTN